MVEIQSGRRGRRWVWASLSLLFVAGLVLSTASLRSERNGALDGVVEEARGEARSVAAVLTVKELAKPVTGRSYDKVAEMIRRSVSSKGSITGVTVWSPRGRVVFSWDRSLVGTSHRDMRPPIVGSVQGSDGWRVLDETVQTFTPVSKGSKRPVAVVEIDRPLAVAESQVGGSWRTVRLGSAAGLAVALLLLGLTFFPSGSGTHEPSDDEQSRRNPRPETDPQQEGSQDAGVIADQQPSEPLAEAPDPALDVPVPSLGEEAVPSVEEDPEILQPDLDQAIDEILQPHIDQAVEHDAGLEVDLEPQESMRQWREEFKARAKQAELRLKKLEAELHEAQSAPGPER